MYIYFYYRLRVHLVSGSVITRRIQCVLDAVVEAIIFRKRDVLNVLIHVQREGIVS